MKTLSFMEPTLSSVGFCRMYRGGIIVYNLSMNISLPQWLSSLAFDISPDFLQPLCPRTGEIMRISFRLWKEAPLRKAFLYLRVDGEYWSKEMGRTADGRDFATWSIEVPVQESQTRFAFVLDSQDGAFFVNRAGAGRHIADAGRDWVVLADQKPPLWFTEGSTYQIFPDRFSRARKEHGVKTGEYSFEGGTTIAMEWKDRPLEWEKGRCLDFFNGDLDGIRKRLPYLAELGVKTLYINPIFSAKTVHRYDCVDYFSVDSHLGGDQALKRLCRDAKAAGLRIVLDISINHTGSEHPWAIAARADPENPEAEYYYRQEDGSLSGWLGVKTLPQLNYRSERLRRIMWGKGRSALRKWLKKPYSIDGWRFDVGNMTARRGADQLSHDVFREVRAAVKEENPEALIIGEHWQDGSDYLQGDQWDGLMNYAACARPLRSFCGERDRYWEGSPPDPVRDPHPLSGSEAAAMIAEHYARMPHLAPHLMLNVLDTHDLYRLHSFKDIFDPGLYRGVLSLQFLLPGSPNIYYGDEVGLEGWPQTAEGLRFPMQWDIRKWKRDFVILYRLLAAMRAGEEALRLGALRILHADADSILIGRFLGAEALVGLMARGDGGRHVRLDARRYGIRSLFSILDPSPGTGLSLRGSELDLEIGPSGSGIWKAALEF